MALNYFSYATIIFTMANADPESNLINNKVIKFVKNNPNCYFFHSLGSQLFFSILKLSTLQMGNSSSGIIESPTLKVKNLNIGKRQEGRVFSDYNINCQPKKREIIKKLNNIINKNILTKVNKKNPYFKKNTPDKILQVLKKTYLDKLNYKIFQDIKI